VPGPKQVHLKKRVSSEKVFGLPARSGRWGFVLAGFFVNICMGAVFSWSIFRKPLEAHFLISATDSILPFIAFTAFFALFMVLTGRFIGRYSPRRVAVLGSLVIGLGWILSSFATNIVFLTITYGVIAGSGIGIVYGCPLAVSARWFPEQKGLAVGLTLSGFGLSALITAPLLQLCINAFGPVRTFAVLGTGFLLVAPLLSLLLRFPRSGTVNAQTLEEETGLKRGERIPELSPSGMARTPAFYGLWICFMIGVFSGLMAIGIASPVGQEIINLSPAAATAFISVFAVFNGGGRALFGWLTDKITPRYAAILSFVIIFLCSVGMLVAKRGDVLLYAACFSGFWMVMGGWLAMAPASTLRFFGNKHYASNYGWIFTADGVGAVLGNLIAGNLRDFLGSYVYAFWPTLGLAFAGIIVAFFLLRQPRLRSRS